MCFICCSINHIEIIWRSIFIPSKISRQIFSKLHFHNKSPADCTFRWWPSPVPVSWLRFTVLAWFAFKSGAPEIYNYYQLCGFIWTRMWLFTIERSWVRIPPTPFRILGTFVYPTLPKSLGMILVYQKRMAVGVTPKEDRGGGGFLMKHFQIPRFQWFWEKLDARKRWWSTWRRTIVSCVSECQVLTAYDRFKALRFSSTNCWSSLHLSTTTHSLHQLDQSTCSTHSQSLFEMGRRFYLSSYRLKSANIGKTINRKNTFK